MTVEKLILEIKDWMENHDKDPSEQETNVWEGASGFESFSKDEFYEFLDTLVEPRYQIHRMKEVGIGGPKDNG